MKRGDIVAAVVSGVYGKARPVVVMQEDAFEGLPSVTILPVTSATRDLPLLRISLEPGPDTGLRIASQVQIDKIMTVPRKRLRQHIGRLDEKSLAMVEELLARFLGLERRYGSSSD